MIILLPFAKPGAPKTKFLYSIKAGKAKNVDTTIAKSIAGV